VAPQEASFNLEDLTDLVSRNHDPAETLRNIVRALQARFQVDVCSIYLGATARPLFYNLLFCRHLHRLTGVASGASQG
jgi:signal transduction protein with GAF and PtsI domain